MKVTCLRSLRYGYHKEIMPFFTSTVKRNETQKQRRSKTKVHRLKNKKKILPIKDGVLYSLTAEARREKEKKSEILSITINVVPVTKLILLP